MFSDMTEIRVCVGIHLHKKKGEKRESILPTHTHTSDRGTGPNSTLDEKIKSAGERRGMRTFTRLTESEVIVLMQ